VATIVRTTDGRPVIAGAGVLPPLDEQADTSTTSTTANKQAKQAATRDRFAMLNKFVDVTMRELTASETLVWLLLYRNGIATAAQSDIARRTGLTQATVSLAIGRLAERGLVRVIRQGGFRKGLSSYRIRGTS
jgi:predicted transcriptional regulator